MLEKAAAGLETPITDNLHPIDESRKPILQLGDIDRHA
jgi:hypothetical protein